jgi:hypothetical protein
LNAPDEKVNRQPYQAPQRPATVGIRDEHASNVTIDANIFPGATISSLTRPSSLNSYEEDDTADAQSSIPLRGPVLLPLNQING